MAGIWHWTERFLELVISLCLVIMTMITVVDVAGRYFFNAPLRGGYEISEIMMGLTVFAALPLATRSESHLTIMLALEKLSERGRRMHRIVILVITVLMLAFIAWRMGAQAAILARSEAASGSLQIPLWPVARAMSILAWLSCLVAAVLTFRALSGRDDGPVQPRETLE